MVRIEKREEHRKAVLPQDTMTIAVAGFGFFFKGELARGVHINGISKWHRSVALFRSQKCANSTLRGGKRCEAKKTLNTYRIWSVCVALIPRKAESPVGPTFF